MLFWGQGIATTASLYFVPPYLNTHLRNGSEVSYDN